MYQFIIVLFVIISTVFSSPQVLSTPSTDLSTVPPLPPDVSVDPFTVPAVGTSPNCGPEERYKFDAVINSTDDFLRFLQKHEGKIGSWVHLDNFREKPKGQIRWGLVEDATKVDRVGERTIYTLEFNPEFCSGFTLKMRDDGHVSVYGCCGE